MAKVVFQSVSAPTAVYVRATSEGTPGRFTLANYAEQADGTGIVDDDAILSTDSFSFAKERLEVFNEPILLTTVPDNSSPLAAPSFWHITPARHQIYMYEMVRFRTVGLTPPSVPAPLQEFYLFCSMNNSAYSFVTRKEWDGLIQAYGTIPTVIRTQAHEAGIQFLMLPGAYVIGDAANGGGQQCLNFIKVRANATLFLARRNFPDWFGNTRTDAESVTLKVDAEFNGVLQFNLENGEVVKMPYGKGNHNLPHTHAELFTLMGLLDKTGR